MSFWGPHNICLACWEKREPTRIPVTSRTGQAPERDTHETCCFCGQEIRAVFFVRSQKPAFCKCVDT